MLARKFNCLTVCLVFVSLFLQAQDTIHTKVACVGNSITAGFGLEKPEVDGYPAQLQTMLDSNWLVMNFGSSGRTMLKTGNLPYWNEPEYAHALEFQPDYVIIKLGTNDSKRFIWNEHGSEYKTDYAEMIKMFRELRSHPEVIICLAIPGQNEGWDIFNSYIVDSLNPRIKEVAFENAVSLIDMYAVYKGHEAEYLLGDSVHPNVTGCSVIATEVNSYLMKPKPQITFVNGSLMAPEAFGYQWYCNGEFVSEDDGGQDQECIPEKPGTYTVLIQPSENSQNMYISEEYIFNIESEK